MEKELKCNVLKLSPKEQEELRKKIVRQMKKRGNTKEVAEICECSLRHVQSTWKKYCESGVAAIQAVKMGKPKDEYCKINTEQAAEIKKLISENSPKELGLQGALWSRAEVSELVKQKYGIKMPVRTMGHYLAKWNFTYQRPKKKITVLTREQ